MAINIKKKLRKFAYFLMCSLILINMTSCTSTDSPNLKEKASSKNKDIEDVETAATVKEFNLGEITVGESNYDLQGVIGVPDKGNNYPVVFILHGDNKKDQTKKMDQYKGFEYLVNQLAHKGYLAVSINVDEQYDAEYGKYNSYKELLNLYNAHVNKLSDAISGNENNYNIDLRGKGNLEELSIISEGESAQGSYYIANEEERLKSMLLISPISNESYSLEYKDIPTGIVIPLLDGVAESLDGQDLYDKLKNDESRKSWTSLVYLDKGNHNYFNQAFTEDDSKFINSNEKVLNPEEQRNFLVKYSLDFLSSALNHQGRGKAFKVTEKTTDKLYGVNVQTRLDVKEKLVIMKPKKNRSVSESFLLGKLGTTGLETNWVRESYITTDDTAGAFRQPGKPKGLTLLNLKWEKEKARLEFKIPSGVNDMSIYNSINLSMAIDSSNELNEKNTAQSMTIVIKDRTGKSSGIDLSDDQPSLIYRQGNVINYENLKTWSSYTPISDLRLPLSLFKNVNIKDVDSISIEFNNTKSGSIMIEDVSLY